MGRNQFKAKQDTNVAPKAVEALLSAFDSPSNDNFALVTQGIDRHRLRIFDPRSGTIKSDFSSSKEDKFTCLAWGTSRSDVDMSKASKKKRKTSSNSQKVLALGLQNGSIAIYSPVHGRIVKTLAGSHTLPINDFVFNQAGNFGYSVSEDHHVVEWDIEEGREISKWKADSKSIKKLALNHSETKLATAGHTINIWDLATKKISKKFTGHASAITNVLFGANDDICVSIAENDRYVNVWDCSSQSDDSGNITALTMDNDIVHVDISSTDNTVLALSEDGITGIWQNASSPTSASAASSGPKSKRKIRSTTRQPDSSIKVVSSDDESSTIPILMTAFMSGSDKDFVIIARGSTIKPAFETVRVLDASGSLSQDIVLTRQNVNGYLVDKSSLAASNLKTTQKKYDESSVTVLGNTDFAISNPGMAQDEEDDEDSNQNEPSIEQKLSGLAVEESGAGNNTGAQNGKPNKYATPSASSLQQMLVQALHSNDTQLLEACLTYSNPEIIRNTVRRLPTTFVIPFLQQIVDKFQERPNRGKALLEWIKAILLIHTAYLMTVPDLVGKLSNFYKALDARLGVFQKLLGLHGRLDLVMSQIDMRSQYAQEDTTNEPINVYVEEDEEEEFEDEMIGEEDDEDDGDMMEYDDEDEDEDEEDDDLDEDLDSDDEE
ncbi:WD40-repeat-containing domain protein [Umbelopsis sp. AD052]|nr:WD40-repeat-containing domain protein [Umbelopsis sp. AD052]